MSIVKRYEHLFYYILHLDWNEIMILAYANETSEIYFTNAMDIWLKWYEIPMQEFKAIKQQFEIKLKNEIR